MFESQSLKLIVVPLSRIESPIFGFLAVGEATNAVLLPLQNQILWIALALLLFYTVGRCG